MINSCRDTKSINKFQYVAIPSPRDIFSKYGERVNANPLYTSDCKGSGPCAHLSPAICSQMYHGQELLEQEVNKI